MSKETISVVGLGYIGLPTATLLSLSGLSVIGVDTNAKIVNDIKYKNPILFSKIGRIKCN